MSKETLIYNIREYINNNKISKNNFLKEMERLYDLYDLTDYTQTEIKIPIEDFFSMSKSNKKKYLSSVKSKDIEMINLNK